MEGSDAILSFYSQLVLARVSALSFLLHPVTILDSRFFCMMIERSSRYTTQYFQRQTVRDTSANVMRQFVFSRASSRGDYCPSERASYGGRRRSG